MGNKLGRPTKYKPEFCQIVIDELKQGASIEELVAVLDVNKDTIYEWIKKHQDFSDAINIGVERSKAWWLKVGRAGAVNKTSVNPALWFMNMKNRFGWRDKLEHSGDKENPLSVDVSVIRSEILKDITKVKADKSNQDKVKREQKRHK